MGQLEGMIQQRKISYGDPAIDAGENVSQGPGEPAPAVPHREDPAFVSPQIVDSNGGFLGVIKSILVILTMLMFVGGGGYYAYAYVYQPMQVKEVVLVSQPIFEDLYKAGEKIVNHLQKEPQTDADSLERYAVEGEGFLKTAKSNQEELDKNISKMTLGMVASYRTKLKDYDEEVKEVIQIEEDNVAFSRSYSEMMRDYERLTVRVSGISNYMISDPDRYLSEVNSLIVDEEKIIEKMKKVAAGNDKDMIEAHELLVRAMEYEVALLKGMKDGVEARDLEKITAAEKVYAESMQNNQKDLSRVSDKLNKRMSDIGDELRSLGEDVDSAYQDLSKRYGL